ncbi:WhiB family transcriptional regulator [Streptomyces sp. 135]|uniref:WhiB family transcriptional regulator n=1 Tax=Streptomyces sp. 135 TaxID=2838850 RepID=UPI001CBF43FC|nr:WhiB family transcriptional regulator [Streptomyces sp. 135]
MSSQPGRPRSGDPEEGHDTPARGPAIGHEENWQAYAACADADPEDFFPVSRHDEESIRIARLSCGRCSVRQRCLAHALDRPEQYGIWAGTTEEERARLRRRGLHIDQAPSRSW